MPNPRDNPGPGFVVRCWTCGSLAYQGDELPADGQPLLTAFADSQCPRGGVDCPHTTAAREAAAAADPQNRLNELEDAAPQVGTVVGTAGLRVVVQVAGTAASLPRLATYTPVVGDTVQIAGPPTRRYVVGKIT